MAVCGLYGTYVPLLMLLRHIRVYLAPHCHTLATAGVFHPVTTETSPHELNHQKSNLSLRNESQSTHRYAPNPTNHPRPALTNPPSRQRPQMPPRPLRAPPRTQVPLLDARPRTQHRPPSRTNPETNKSPRQSSPPPPRTSSPSTKSSRTSSPGGNQATSLLSSSASISGSLSLSPVSATPRTG